MSILSPLVCLSQHVAIADWLRRILPMVRGRQICRFSINFLRFAWVFEKEFSSIMMAFPQSSRFAALRLRVNRWRSHGARRGFVYLTRRREEEKLMSV
jgi:hemolysin-activating ACP:hemolysin acyltransferase